MNIWFKTSYSEGARFSAKGITLYIKLSHWDENKGTVELEIDNGIKKHTEQICHYSDLRQGKFMLESFVDKLTERITHQVEIEKTQSCLIDIEEIIEEMKGGNNVKAN